VLPDGNILSAWFGGTEESADDVAIWGAVREKPGARTPLVLPASYDNGISREKQLTLDDGPPANFPIR